MAATVRVAAALREPPQVAAARRPTACRSTRAVNRSGRVLTDFADSPPIEQRNDESSQRVLKTPACPRRGPLSGACPGQRAPATGLRKGLIPALLALAWVQAHCSPPGFVICQFASQAEPSPAGSPGAGGYLLGTRPALFRLWRFHAAAATSVVPMAMFVPPPQDQELHAQVRPGANSLILLCWHLVLLGRALVTRCWLSWCPRGPCVRSGGACFCVSALLSRLIRVCRRRLPSLKIGRQPRLAHA